MPTAAIDFKAVFGQALEITSPKERAAFLEKACGGDQAARDRIETLLKADGQAGEFLGGVEAGDTVTHDLTVIAEEAGTSIGSYKLLEKLGAGGMGVVFKAQQKQPDRRVALKIIKDGCDSKQIIARFEAEEQALAMMNHPNIARMFDAGTTAAGLPYFVMELIDGQPITDYCHDELSKQNLRERLDLFIAVCDAVQHAHQKGIIHRDIKPSNVLVTLQEGKPVVKVIDFGIAKAVNQPLTEKTLYTQSEALLGTPAYMSPEQAKSNGQAVDTRTDIYSLGVLLYELLTGTTPFDKQRLRDAGFDGMRKIIREEVPPKPSTKISTACKTAADNPEPLVVDSKKRSAIVRGDLDWIVMKAMEKNQTRRYETAKDLAADIERHLYHEPVEASPPSTLYRMGRFVQRNRSMVAGALVAVFLLASFVAVGAYGIVASKIAQIDRLEKEKADHDRLLAEAAKRAAEEEKRAAETVANNLEFRKISLPRLRQLKDGKRWREAFTLAVELQRRFPTDDEIKRLWIEVSCTWSVGTEPAGAKVMCRPYGSNEPWTQLGTTPLTSEAVCRGFYHWKIEKDGYQLVEGCAGEEHIDLRRTLELSVPNDKDMVRVNATTTDREIDFSIDRFEVTNGQYKKFVDAGGYAKPEFWTEQFKEDDKDISWNEAMKRFVDASGEPGPSTWQGGTFPPGEADFPVRGISWYEAAAYARFVKKSLPTIHDREFAAGTSLNGWIAPVSNLENDTVAKVGEFVGVGPFGTYDMAGNVKEWCWNRAAHGHHYILGGSWSDPAYMARIRDARPPMDRSETNGFRCVNYLVPPQADQLADVVVREFDWGNEEPVGDKEYLVIRESFDYDKRPLNGSIVSTTETRNCTHEVVEFESVYGDPRMIVHLFLPTAASLPYQPVVYFPGVHATRENSFPKDASEVRVVPALLASGRAVVWPVYAGTYERRDAKAYAGPQGLAKLTIRRVQDLRRTVDYLESRPSDFDRNKLGYVGSSFGALNAPPMLAIENRIQAAVLLHGGLPSSRTRVRLSDTFNYLPRIKIPVLMVNSENDHTFPVETSQIPFFQKLGTPRAERDHRLFPGSHVVAMDIQVRETLEWLDLHLGKVGPLAPRKPKDVAGELALSLRAIEREFGTEQFSRIERECRDLLSKYKPTLGANNRQILRTQFQLGKAIHAQRRHLEAIGLLEETLVGQTSIPEPRHSDTEETAAELGKTLVGYGWEIAHASDKSLEEYQAAEELLQRRRELAPKEEYFWVIAYAQLRQHHVEASLASLRESVAASEDVVGQYFIFAMAHGEAGDTELAAAWYGAACEWIAKTRNKYKPVLQLRNQVAYRLKLPTAWPPEDWDAEKRVEMYSQLIEDYPDIARLYHSRGSHFGRIGMWDRALTDYQEAAELAPNNRSHLAECAAVAMYSQSDRVNAIVEQMFDESTKIDHDFKRLTYVMACSLVPTETVDRQRIDAFAQSALEANSDNPYVQCCRGMSLYRLGQFDGYRKAVKVLPPSDANYVNPKDELLALIFRAMTHCQLGDAFTCRELLAEARLKIAEKLPTPHGPLLRYEDRPVAWCMVETALREAEELIETADKNQRETTTNE